MSDRSRVVQASALAVTIALGLGVRAMTGGDFAKIAGDVLYAVAAFFAVGFAWPRGTTARVALVAFAYCAAIELLQLWHPPWLEAARATLPGRLVLGRVFSVYDLASYAAGVAAAALLERARARLR